eukprot:g3439.t1
MLTVDRVEEQQLTEDYGGEQKDRRDHLLPLQQEQQGEGGGGGTRRGCGSPKRKRRTLMSAKKKTPLVPLTSLTKRNGHYDVVTSISHSQRLEMEHRNNMTNEALVRMYKRHNNTSKNIIRNYDQLVQTTSLRNRRAMLLSVEGHSRADNESKKDKEKKKHSVSPMGESSSLKSSNLSQDWSQDPNVLYPDGTKPRLRSSLFPTSHTPTYPDRNLSYQLWQRKISTKGQKRFKRHYSKATFANFQHQFTLDVFQDAKAPYFRQRYKLAFLKRRSRISEIVATKDIIFGLSHLGVCTAYSPSHRSTLCFLNISPDEVIRSLFYNKANDSLITVSVYRYDNYSSLKCRSTPIEFIRRKKPEKGYAIFESESLRWPGFVEFDDVNGKVLTYSAANNMYKVWNLSNYTLLYTLDDEGITEIKISPGVMLLIYGQAHDYVPLRILSVDTGNVLLEFKYPLHSNHKIDFIEQFNEKLLLKQENFGLEISDIRTIQPLTKDRVKSDKLIDSTAEKWKHLTTADVAARQPKVQGNLNGKKTYPDSCSLSSSSVNNSSPSTNNTNSTTMSSSESAPIPCPIIAPDICADLQEGVDRNGITLTEKQFNTPSAFIFLYENQLFLTFLGRDVTVWNFKGEPVTTFKDHRLWQRDCTNTIYISSQQDVIISYCRKNVEQIHRNKAPTRDTYMASLLPKQIPKKQCSGVWRGRRHSDNREDNNHSGTDRDDGDDHPLHESNGGKSSKITNLASYFPKSPSKYLWGPESMTEIDCSSSDDSSDSDEEENAFSRRKKRKRVVKLARKPRPRSLRSEYLFGRYNDEDETRYQGWLHAHTGRLDAENDTNDNEAPDKIVIETGTINISNILTGELIGKISVNDEDYPKVRDTSGVDLTSGTAEEIRQRESQCPLKCTNPLRDVTALFYNEHRNEIYTGREDGTIAVWSSG